jgi:Domain of unknown function (DUF5916)/Carbohydrate family 9 binding domain-like
MRKLKDVLLTYVCLMTIISINVEGFSAESQKAPHKIPQVSSKVKIDGVLDDKAWEQAVVLTLNYEVEPGENIAPPVKTEVMLVYGEKHLYAGFRVYDPNPEKIRAHVTDRDNIWNDDHVGIVLDTFNDSRLTHNFYCNPLGVQADQMSTLTSDAESWDAIWNSAGRINKEGYCVEMAIPFTSLRFQGKKGDQVWGIDAVRSYPRLVTHTIGLFPRDRSNNCYMCQADKVVGFSGAKPGNNLEFDPTLSTILTQEREQFPDGKFIDAQKKVEPGLTARWSFTPNLTLNAAINPDFSQVEADNAQLDINTQFALYYPEKRPFFMEGSNIFESQFTPVYTRTVADPEWGIKLSGKEKKHSIAMFTARDTITNLILPTSQSSRLISLNMNNLSTALRYRYDVGRSSNVGIFITNREGEDYFNRLVGIDADIRLTKTDRIAVQYLGSQTRYPGEVASQYNQPDDKFSGGALDVFLTHNTQNVLAYGHYQDIAPNFRSDVGFFEQTGTKLYDVGAAYSWRKSPGHWFTTIQVGGQYFRLIEQDNQPLLRYFEGFIYYYGPLQSWVRLRANFGKRNYFGKEFKDNNVNITITGRPTGNLFIGLAGNYGDRADFVNVREGKRLRLNLHLEYNMGRHFYLKFDHVYESLKVEGGRLYNANLTNLSASYQFSRRAFLRAILQYADYNYNSELYLNPRDPQYNHLFSQILFSYKINPRTVLFLGYSDDSLGFSYIPLTQNNRTFFMKIGYALVL